MCVPDAIRDELTTILHLTPEGALAIADDPDDDRVLGCGVATDANINLTGDGLILRLGNWPQQPPLDRLRFLTRRQFLDERESWPRV